MPKPKRIASKVIANLTLNLPIKLAMLEGRMDVFRVDLDSQYGVLHPGQLVTGRVVIHLRENIKARAVLLHVVGKAKTHWVVWEQAKDRNVSNSGAVTQKSVPYSAEVVYVDLQINLWIAPTDHQALSPGVHNFPFSFTLPPHCPPSFEGTIGFIRFCCKAKIDRPWKFDDTTRAPFTVMPHFDLNTVFQAGAPCERQISKNIGVLCFKHGRIAAKITVPKCGFVPGETIPINAEIVNSTTKAISRIETSLIETVVYSARRHHLLLEATVNRHHEIERKIESRTVVHHVDDFKIAPNSQQLFQRLIAVPPVVPSFNICPIIQVDYKLKIKIITKGTLSNSVSCDVPVLVGTIPIRTQPQQSISPQLYPQISGPSQPGSAAPDENYLMPPQPSSLPEDSHGMPPPSYAESVFGRGTVQEGDDEKTTGFTPKYVFYNNF